MGGQLSLSSTLGARIFLTVLRLLFRPRFRNQVRQTSRLVREYRRLVQVPSVLASLSTVTTPMSATHRTLTGYPHALKSPCVQFTEFLLAIYESNSQAEAGGPPPTVPPRRSPTRPAQLVRSAGSPADFSWCGELASPRSPSGEDEHLDMQIQTIRVPYTARSLVLCNTGKSGAGFRI